MSAEKLALPTVTLVAVDCVNAELALDAMERSMALCAFARAVLLTSQETTPRPGIEVIAIPPISSKREYSVFMVKGLAAHVATPHALTVQWDGFVTDTAAWDPRFLDVDYIGAPWPPDLSNRQVGNGGFSLRSRRLLQALQEPTFPEAAVIHEDQAICNLFRDRLEAEFGIRFAPPELAARFAHETVHDGKPTFGFHGPQNLGMYWQEAEIDRCLRLVSRHALRAPEMVWLARHLAAAGRYRETAKVAGATLVEQPANSEILDILAQLRDRTKNDDYMARSEARFLLGNLKRHLPEAFRNRTVLELTRSGVPAATAEWFEGCAPVAVPGAGGEPPELYAARSESFDTIVSCGALEYLPRWRETVRNLLRLLRRDGLLFLACAGPGRRRPESATGDFRAVDARELAAVVQGFPLAHLDILEDRMVHDVYVIAAGAETPPAQVATLRRFLADQAFLLRRRNVHGLP